MISVHMLDGGLNAKSIGRSCILTDFSWTTPLPFLDIMLGSQKHPKLFSVIFEVRTLIFGTQPLHPYVDRRFSVLLDRRNLIIEPPVGQSHSHSAPNRPAFNVGQSPLEGSRMLLVDPKWAKLSGFYVVTTLETILG